MPEVHAINDSANAKSLRKPGSLQRKVPHRMNSANGRRSDHRQWRKQKEAAARAQHKKSSSEISSFQEYHPLVGRDAIYVRLPIATRDINLCVATFNLKNKIMHLKMINFSQNSTNVDSQNDVNDIEFPMPNWREDRVIKGATALITRCSVVISWSLSRRRSCSSSSHLFVRSFNRSLIHRSQPY